MTRRLRLALLVAALVVAGPAPSVRAVDAGRLDVSIAWFCSERAVVRRFQHSSPPISCSAADHSGFHAHAGPPLPTALLSYSQFQRPPPLQN